MICKYCEREIPENRTICGWCSSRLKQVKELKRIGVKIKGSGITGKKAEVKKVKPIVEVPKPVPVNIPLPRMMQLLELYNQNHGTKYSYGQFVSGLHTGKIKIGVVKNE